MNNFSKKIDKRSRKKMIEFLTGHFRYNTMNGWNNSTSYANNLKIYNLGLSREQVDKLFDLLTCDNDVYRPIDNLMYKFNEKTNFRWQAGWNGRSNGYLVLYNGEAKPSGYKSFCTACFQGNYQSVEESGNCKCGKCGKDARIDYKNPPKQISVFPGKPIDMGENFEDWSTTELRERVRLIQDFDKLCDKIVKKAAYIADNYEVREEKVLIPTTVRKVRRKSNGKAVF